jgi:hypothetical protein
MVSLSLWIDKGIGLIIAAFAPSPVGVWVTGYARSLPDNSYSAGEERLFP